MIKSLSVLVPSWLLDKSARLSLAAVSLLDEAGNSVAGHAHTRPPTPRRPEPVGAAQRPDLRWLIGYLGLALAMVVLDGSNGVERGIYTWHHTRIADWLSGARDPSLLSYPVWGYGAFMSLLGRSEPLILFTQAVLATAAWWTWHRALWARTPNRYLHLAFALGALPWFSLAATLQPTSPAASFGLLGVAGLLAADRDRRWILGACAAVSLGLAGHFRFEWLGVSASGALMSLFLGRTRPRLIAGFALAITLILPWHLAVRHATGRAHLTPTNGPMVAWISLGALPFNPWRIENSDDAATDFVRARGVRYPFSPKGAEILRSDWLDAIADHPGAFAGKVAWNAGRGLVGGLYFGRLCPIWRDVSDVVAERKGLKQAIKAGDLGGVVRRWASVASVAWEWGLRFLLGVPLLVLALVGARSLAWRSRSTTQAVCLGMWAGQIAVCALTQWQTRHMSQVLPFILPYLAIGLSVATSRLAVIARIRRVDTVDANAGVMKPLARGSRGS